MMSNFQRGGGIGRRRSVAKSAGRSKVCGTDSSCRVQILARADYELLQNYMPGLNAAADNGKHSDAQRWGDPGSQIITHRVVHSVNMCRRRIRHMVGVESVARPVSNPSHGRRRIRHKNYIMFLDLVLRYLFIRMVGKQVVDKYRKDRRIWAI